MKYIQGLKILYAKFPRQFCTTYRQDVQSFKELLELINRHNGKKRIYCSIVDYNEKTKDLVDLDKIAFDLDEMELCKSGMPRCLEDTIKLHNYLEKENIKHTMVFSGRGFHVYVFTKNYEMVTHHRFVLRMTHDDLIKRLDILVDKHIVGDVARVFTIPGTYNTKRGRFAIFINDSDLMLGYEHIQQKASVKQFTDPVFYGTDFLNLSQLVVREKERVEIPNIQIEIKSDDKFIMLLPPCIQLMVLEKGDWRSRWIFTLYCKEVLGFPKEKTKELAKKYFSKFLRTDDYKNNWEHYKRVRTADYVYSRDDVFPNCETMFRDGHCPGKCAKYNSFYMKD